MSRNGQEQATLKEFESLRSELLALTHRVNIWTQVTWAGIATLLSASVIAESPYPAVISVILAMVNWCEGIRISRGASIIGAYIEKIIEPNLPGLEWETTVHQRITHPREPLSVLTKRHFAQKVAYLVSFTSLFLLFQFTSMDRSEFIWIPISIACLAFLGGCCFVYDYKSASDRDYYRKQMCRAETTIARQAQPPPKL